MQESNNGASFQTRIIERDIERLANRFDRHLEIYAQNNKELAALKSSIESHGASVGQIAETISRHEQEIQERKAEVSGLTARLSVYAAGASFLASGLSAGIIQILFFQ